MTKHASFSSRRTVADDGELSLGAGWAAMRRGDFEDAVAAFSQAMNFDRSRVSAAFGRGAALARLDRMDDAISALRAACILDSAQVPPRVLLGQLLMHQGDLPGAEATLRTAIAVAPNHAEALGVLGAVLGLQDRPDEAEAILWTAVGLAPDLVHLWLTLGRIALAADHIKTAQTAFKAALKVEPDHSGARAAIKQIMDQLRLRASVRCENEYSQAYPTELAYEGMAPITTSHFLVIDDPETANLLMNFQSLGVNCEFGLLQRRFGAEPLGLLRWANTTPQQIVALLQADFAGYGDLMNTEVSLAAWGEFLVHDRIYGTVRHSFIQAKGLNQADFLERETRRLRFLRDMLLRDIESGEKILVYHHGPNPLSDEEIKSIHSGVRRLGPSCLLITKLSDLEHKPGTVENRGDRLLVGYLDKFGLVARPGGGSEWNISFDTWRIITQRALKIVNESRAV